MQTTTHTQLVRIRVSGRTCRSKERLLSRTMDAVPGVTATLLDERDVLTTLVDMRSLDVKGLVAAIVDAGLVPEEVVRISAIPTITGGEDD